MSSKLVMGLDQDLDLQNIWRVCVIAHVYLSIYLCVCVYVCVRACVRLCVLAQITDA